jgi:hypothetical protein
LALNYPENCAVEVANILLKEDSSQSKYQSWASKLQDVYTKDAAKIQDAYTELASK